MKESFLKHNIGFDEYITGNRFIDICEDSEAVFCKTDFIRNYTNSECRVFVTHNSDYHIDDTVVTYGPKNQHWFMQNKDVPGDNLISIPIGLENMQLRTQEKAQKGLFSSQIDGALEKALLIDKLASYEMPKTHLAYMNFNKQTHASRNATWNSLCEKEWITKADRVPMQQFYFDVASHKFIISPRGNGVDCHRTWEALYLRTIPIVQRSTHMNEFSDLPIYFVDNWEDLCYVKLEEYYKKVESSLFDLGKMKISWWRDLINEKLS